MGEEEWVAFVYDNSRDGGRQSIYVDGKEVIACTHKAPPPLLSLSCA